MMPFENIVRILLSLNSHICVSFSANACYAMTEYCMTEKFNFFKKHDFYSRPATFFKAFEFFVTMFPLTKFQLTKVMKYFKNI